MTKDKEGKSCNDLSQGMTPEEFKHIRMKQLQMTQQQLADKIGVDIKTVQNYEYGINPIKTYIKYCMLYLELGG